MKTKILLYRKAIIDHKGIIRGGDWQAKTIELDRAKSSALVGEYDGSRNIIDVLREIKAANPSARLYVPEHLDNPTLLNNRVFACVGEFA